MLIYISQISTQSGSIEDAPQNKFLCEIWRAERKQQPRSGSHVLSLICQLISWAWGCSQDHSCSTVPWILLNFVSFWARHWAPWERVWLLLDSYTIHIRAAEADTGFSPPLWGPACLVFYHFIYIFSSSFPALHTIGSSIRHGHDSSQRMPEQLLPWVRSRSWDQFLLVVQQLWLNWVHWLLRRAFHMSIYFKESVIKHVKSVSNFKLNYSKWFNINYMY